MHFHTKPVFRVKGDYVQARKRETSKVYLDDNDRSRDHYHDRFTAVPDISGESTPQGGTAGSGALAGYIGA